MKWMGLRRWLSYADLTANAVKDYEECIQTEFGCFSFDLFIQFYNIFVLN
jgi:hypothetical protein